jgi:branched-chain amino acid transport system substrate-binding protein
MKGLNWVVTLVVACVTWSAAQAEISDDAVRVGVLNDISGIFQDTNGMGSVEAARMAAEDFNGGGKNIKVEIVYADHQNKADVGSAIARKWLDVDKVDAIVDVPNSTVGSYHQLAAARFPHDISGVVDRKFGPHGQGLLAEHHPVGQ